MIARVDDDYREDGAVAACMLSLGRPDDRPASESAVRIEEVEPYVPGEFYRRELPCLLAVLGTLDRPPEVVIGDGHVRLGDDDGPGLGAHLRRAMGGGVVVVGVAKTRFLRATTRTGRPSRPSAPRRPGPSGSASSGPRLKEANDLVRSRNALLVEANARESRINADLKASNEKFQARFDLAQEAIHAFQATVTEDPILKDERFYRLDSTGEPARAPESFGRALAIRQQLADANPTIVSHQSDLMTSLAGLGVVFPADPFAR